MKFVRRKDLDAQTRLEIVKAGFSAMGIYGSMTQLAIQYDISRTFLYQLMAAAMLYLTEMFSVDSQNASPHQMDIAPLIALLRLEGKCSISNISEILKVLNYSENSTGMISQRLTQYGKMLPSTLSYSYEHLVIYLSDEIFALGCPFLFYNNETLKRLKHLQKHLIEAGISTPVHGNIGRKPKHAFATEDRHAVKEFIINFASVHGLPDPGRDLRIGAGKLRILLPAMLNYRSVHRTHRCSGLSQKSFQ